VGRQHAAQPQRWKTRVAVAQAVFGDHAAVPDCEHAERLGQILDDELGPQLIEVEPLHEGRGERARAIEEKAAAVGGRRLRQDEIDNDLALRGQQRAKARGGRRHLGDVAGHEPVEEFARVVAGDLDDAAVGKQRGLHGT